MKWYASLSARSVLIAGIWLLAVMALVPSVEAGFSFWRRQREELLVAQQRFARLLGWLQDQEKVTAYYQEALGPLVPVAGADMNWRILQGLQQAAQGQGLSVQELRPSQLPAQGREPPVLRFDLKLVGSLEKMGAFLQQLPAKMPGAHLENLQLLPAGGGQAQGLVRLSLPLPEQS